ncbi:hypothetical protein [Sneathia sanguinegens]|uniref:hypothetical protein n=1 Tax=Sneathia sanguinegens TaxID=40543 RepID=UPI00258597D8|nr:hypothetical protein [Sneathia sanguinegens]MDU4652799.1 hypothetical protein [Sneathia sanguinegens]
MSMLNLLDQIEKLDVENGYEQGGNNLPDGNYDALCEDIIFTDKEKEGKGYIYTIKLKTLENDSYASFYNINEKTVKFNAQNLLVAISNISQTELNVNDLKIKMLTDGNIFVGEVLPLIQGKQCTFELKTNKNGYQTCKIFKAEDMPF